MAEQFVCDENAWRTGRKCCPDCEHPGKATCSGCGHSTDRARGLADGARQERERVVAWLRECAAETMIGGLVAATFATAADLIERGDHILPDKDG